MQIFTMYSSVLQMNDSLYYGKHTKQYFDFDELNCLIINTLFFTSQICYGLAVVSETYRYITVMSVE